MTGAHCALRCADTDGCEQECRYDSDCKGDEKCEASHLTKGARLGPCTTYAASTVCMRCDTHRRFLAGAWRHRCCTINSCSQICVNAYQHPSLHLTGIGVIAVLLCSWAIACQMISDKKQTS